MVCERNTVVHFIFVVRTGFSHYTRFILDKEISSHKRGKFSVAIRAHPIKNLSMSFPYTIEIREQKGQTKKLRKQIEETCKEICKRVG